MAKMGRPKTGNAKEKKITIRVSDKEYDLIEEYAMKHSITKSEVLKKALLYIRENK